VELLLRTSGEQRLSDFLTWESRSAALHFTPTLWPDLSLADLLLAVVEYQRLVRAGGGPRAGGAGLAPKPPAPWRELSPASGTEANDSEGSSTPRDGL